MKSILTVVGARPQFIKSAAVSRLIQGQFAEHLTEVIVHTGQHYSDTMSGLHFSQMELQEPHRILHLQHAHDPARRMAEMIEQLAQCIDDFRPDALLVYGDTDSTLAGALAADLRGVPLVHVEAGLRSHRRDMPEERNRILTDHLAYLLFTPTSRATAQLHHELQGRSCRIVQSGDVMLDNVMHYKSQMLRPNGVQNLHGEMVLLTAHRADTMNQRERFLELCGVVEGLLNRYDVVWPMHPRTAAQMIQWLGEADAQQLLQHPHLQAIEPVGYLETLWLLEHCHYVVTDSGGLQKEAAFFQKPVAILRDETEWVELLEAGSAILTGVNCSHVLSALDAFSQTHIDADLTPFGQGKASEIICRHLIQDLAVPC